MGIAVQQRRDPDHGLAARDRATRNATRPGGDSQGLEVTHEFGDDIFGR
jgi:hypothetical protein